MFLITLFYDNNFIVASRVLLMFFFYESSFSISYIEDITRCREDMNFMFEWQQQYEILFLLREHKIHIFEPPCNVLFVVWRLNKRDARNQFNKSKRRES